MKTYAITKLNKLSYPRFMIFFDTETTQQPKEQDEQAHRFRLGVAIYVELDKEYNLASREVFYFNEVSRFWQYVASKAQKDRVLYVYAHNIKYDLMSVQFEKFIPQIGFKAQFPVLGHNFIMQATKKGNRKIKFHDSFNYFKTRLKTMGKAVGQHKIKLKSNLKIKLVKGYQYPPIRLKKFSTHQIYFNHVDDKTLYKYCENDVEIVEKIMLRLIHFLREDGKGSLEPTAAGVAFNVFRTRFNDESIHYHKDLTLLQFERSAYKGGRVECFYVGQKKDQFYLYDVNSMYAWVMATCELPTEPLIYADKMSKSEALSLSQSHYLISEVVLNYKAYIGYYGTHYDSKLLFPIGQFKTVLHNPELIRALEENHILSIGKTYVYKKSKCLSSYANYFYEMRLSSSDSTYNLFAKLMNNSLYGRLGMSYYEKEVLEEGEGDSENPIGMVMIQEREGDRIVWKPYYRWYGKLIRTFKDEYKPKRNTNVALAGAVTAYARMKLLDYILEAGYRNAFYCDTDSILVNERGASALERFIDKKALGQLKQEMNCQSITINAPKDYVFGSKRRLKGIPAQFEQSEDGSYQFIRFTTIREYLRNEGVFFGTKDQHKILTYNYNKGIILNDNFTSPIVLNEVS